MKGKEQQQLAHLTRKGRGAESNSLDPLMTLLVQVATKLREKRVFKIQECSVSREELMWQKRGREREVDR